MSKGNWKEVENEKGIFNFYEETPIEGELITREDAVEAEHYYDLESYKKELTEDEQQCKMKRND